MRLNPPHVGELPPQIVGQTLDDLRPPAGLRLPRQNVPADLPVEEDELAVDGERGANPRVPDTLLERTEKRGIVERRLRRKILPFHGDPFYRETVGLSSRLEPGGCPLLDIISQICETGLSITRQEWQGMPETPVRFYREADGSTPVLDWLVVLSGQDHRAFQKCRAAIDRLAAFGHELRRPQADLLRDGIYELRTRVGRVNYRILYFFHGREAAVLAHSLTKEDRVPPAEIDRALERKRRFEANPVRHTYEEE